MNKYIQQKQELAKLDVKGNVLGKIDKWEAHRKGILHKGFSITLIYKNKYILQHRKHPVFDGYFDLTSSSHPIYKNGKLQTIIDAVYDCLKREWDLGQKDLAGEIKEIGEIYYKAKDPNSSYAEHEKCVMLIAKVKKLPTPNFDYAYGFSLVSKEELRNTRIFKDLCPWSQEAIKENVI